MKALKTPQNLSEAIGLLEYLTPKDKMLCGVVAAELVLPLQDNVYLMRSAQRWPIVSAKRWIKGFSSDQELDLAKKAAMSSLNRNMKISGASPDGIGAHSAWAAVLCADSKLGPAQALAAAHTSAEKAGLADEKTFVQKWWAACKEELTEN